jgi:hypothetical protein
VFSANNFLPSCLYRRLCLPNTRFYGPQLNATISCGVIRLLYIIYSYNYNSTPHLHGAFWIFRQINENVHFIKYKQSLTGVVPLLRSAGNGRRKIEHGCWLPLVDFTICLPCLSVWRKFSTAQNCAQGMENKRNGKLSPLSRSSAMGTEQVQQLLWLSRWASAASEQSESQQTVAFRYHRQRSEKYRINNI